MSWLRKFLLKWVIRHFKVPRDVFRFAWKRYADRTALISPAGTLTYTQLRSRGLQLASAWVQSGLKKGDVCYVQLLNGADLIVANIAATESGIILSGIPPHAREAFLERAIQFVTPKAILYDVACTESKDILGRLIPDLKPICFNQIPDSEESLEYSKVEIHPDDIASIGFTSGTTGAPKVLSALHGTYITSLRLMIDNVELKPQTTPDKALIGIPVAGAGSGLVLPTLLSGGTIIIPAAYSADEFLKLIPAYQVTRVFTTPSLLIDLLDHPALDSTDISSLRNIIYGTELMPAAKLEQALRRFGPILQQGYGSAEVLPPVSMLQPHEHMQGRQLAPRSVLSSVGRVVPQVRVMIADEDDQSLPQGQIGNILIKSPTQFLGYLKQPELNEKILRGGWLHIGDIGYFDDDGFLHVLGRKPDLIDRHGHITYPRQVEEVLHDHPAVKEVTFVQVGSQGVMAVSLRQQWRHKLLDSMLGDELKRFLATRIPQSDMPDSIVIFEELPRSPLAKVLRREVRQLLTDQFSGGAS